MNFASTKNQNKFSSVVDGLNIPRKQVSNHNDPICGKMLKTARPELVVLGGTRIIRPYILEIPPRGTLNAHPGLLPWLRGSSSVGWALYKDLPVGSTIHFIDADIDTGPIVLQRELPVHKDDTYESLVHRVLTLSGELMAETVALMDAGEAPRTPQDRTVGETLRVIPSELLEEAKARLAEGRYSHFSE